MPQGERGVVKPPNLDQFSSNRAANGFLPLTREAGATHPTNLSRFMHGDPGGSADLTKQPSPIDPPNGGKFVDGDAGYTPRPGSAIEPGKAAVPTNPFVGSAALLGRSPSETLQSK